MGFMEDWHRRHLDRYAREYGRGEHDEACEQRERSYICHCSKRKREAEGKTDLPIMVIHYPTCGTCDNDLDHDGDSWRCETCKVIWDSHATDGDKAEEFSDDYGDDFGGEQFGRLLREVV